MMGRERMVKGGLRIVSMNISSITSTIEFQEIHVESTMRHWQSFDLVQAVNYSDVNTILH